MSTRCLVTGGAGFIGSNLVDALVARGDEVTVVDTLVTGRAGNLDGALARGARLHEVDVRDAAALAEVVAAARPETIFHLAAQIDVRRSVEDPAHDARVNVEGTLNLLEAARLAGVRRLVYSSTGGGLYGDAGVIPTAEDAPVRPLAPYGQSKYAAEGACELYGRLHGLDSVVLRYANVYGPRQDPLGEGGVIAIFCGKAASGGTPVIYGDGTQTRDFVFVGDVVDANLRAASAPVGSQAGGPFNVGTGEETTVLELLDALRELAPGQALEPRFEPGRPGEVARSCLEVSRAREGLGWAPATSLSDGLRRTLEAVG